MKLQPGDDLTNGCLFRAIFFRYMVLAELFITSEADLCRLGHYLQNRIRSPTEIAIEGNREAVELQIAHNFHLNA